MKMRRTKLVSSAAALAAVAIAAPVYAGQLFTFEDSETVTVTTPNMGMFTWLGGIAHVNNAYERVEGTLTRYEPTDGYVWGQSFGSDSGHNEGFTNHTRSTIGATDGSYSMNIQDPDGDFTWGTQVLFNNTADPRFIDLTTSTRLMFDISTPGGPPPNGLPAYQVGFGAINYAAGFLDSYNLANVGNNYQFASGPESQTELTTQTYLWDFGGQMVAAAGSVWPGLTDYVIFHWNQNSPAGLPADYYLDNVRVINESSSRSTWQTIATGDWTSGGNWNAAGVPNGVGAPAIFYGIGAPNGTTPVNATVNVNGAITVGSIIFDAQITTYARIGASGAVTDPSQLPAVVNYTLGGGGSLTFDVASGNAELYAVTGNHNINVPVTVNDNFRIDTGAGFGPDNNPDLPGGGRHSSAPRAAVTFGAPLTLESGVTLRTSGIGSVTFNGPVNGTQAALLFNGGRINLGANVNVNSLSIAPAARVAVTSNGNTVVRTTALAVGDGTLPSALDLTNNKMIVDYPAADAEPFDTIKALITSGYAGGTWTGPGINSSAAAAVTTHGLGFAESSSIFTTFPATFGGQQVDETAVLVAYTRYGDANLDGLVNLADFNRLAANFGSTNASWAQGDFNYDMLVNLSDFNRLAANFGLSASPDGPTPEDWAALAAAVPEPATGLAVLSLALMTTRRRRRR